MDSSSTAGAAPTNGTSGAAQPTPNAAPPTQAAPEGQVTPPAEGAPPAAPGTPGTRKVAFRRKDGTPVELEVPEDARYVRKAKWPKKDGTFEERDLDEDEVYGNFDLRRRMEEREQTALQERKKVRTVLETLSTDPGRLFAHLPEGAAHRAIIGLVQHSDPRIQQEVALAFQELQAENAMPEDQRRARDFARQQREFEAKRQAFEQQQQQLQQQHADQQNQIRLSRTIHHALGKAGVAQVDIATISEVARELDQILPPDADGIDVHPMYMEQAVKSVVERREKERRYKEWEASQAQAQQSAQAKALEDAKRKASQPGAPRTMQQRMYQEPPPQRRMTLEQLREKREAERDRAARGR